MNSLKTVWRTTVQRRKLQFGPVVSEGRFRVQVHIYLLCWYIHVHGNRIYITDETFPMAVLITYIEIMTMSYEASVVCDVMFILRNGFLVFWGVSSNVMSKEISLKIPIGILTISSDVLTLLPCPPSSDSIFAWSAALLPPTPSAGVKPVTTSTIADYCS